MVFAAVGEVFYRLSTPMERVFDAHERPGGCGEKHAFLYRPDGWHCMKAAVEAERPF